MKKFWITSTISALLLVTASNLLMSEKTLADNVAVRNIREVKYTSPLITRSVAFDDTFLIKLSASTLPLNDIEITLPKQDISFEFIKITDQFGKEIKSDIKKNKEQILLTFAEAIQPGTSLQIRFRGVNTQAVMGRILLYRLSVQPDKLGQRIPIGVARIYVPDAS